MTEEKEDVFAQFKSEFQEPVSCEALMDSFEAARRQLDRLKDQQKIAQTETDELEARLIEAMTQAGQKSVKRLTGTMFTLVEKKYFRTGAENRGAQREYLMEKGLEDMLSVNAQTWSGYCKQLDEAGEKLPEFVLEHKEIGLSVRGLK